MERTRTGRTSRSRSPVEIFYAVSGDGRPSLSAVLLSAARWCRRTPQAGSTAAVVGSTPAAGVVVPDGSTGAAVVVPGGSTRAAAVAADGSTPAGAGSIANSTLSGRYISSCLKQVASRRFTVALKRTSMLLLRAAWRFAFLLDRLHDQEA